MSKGSLTPRDATERVAQHTPGPWICYADLPSVEPNWHIVTNASRMRVLANVHIEPGNAVDEANARLIAAAPDLLAAVAEIACQELSTDMSVDDQLGGDFEGAYNKMIEVARAAIAKAEGR